MNVSALLRVLLPLAALGLMAGCKPAAEPAADERLRVLTTFLPLQAHASAIAGDLAVVEQLLDGSVGPHDFEPGPTEIRRLVAADVLLVNGLGLESWLGRLLESGASDLRVVDTSSGLPVRPGTRSLGGGTASSGSDLPNPHVWLDPVLARSQAEAVLEALRLADPENRASYEARAARYFAELDALHGEFVAALAGAPQRNLVSLHDAFPYLAARYGLAIRGHVSAFPEDEPTPRRLAHLAEIVQAEGIAVVFAERGYDAAILERLAATTGARVAELDTLEIGTGHPGAYLERMRANLEVLRRHLGAHP